MLQNLFLFTRVTFLNFHNGNMVALPVLAFVLLLALRLLLGNKQPCKALMLILPKSNQTQSHCSPLRH